MTSPIPGSHLADLEWIYFPISLSALETYLKRCLFSMQTASLLAFTLTLCLSHRHIRDFRNSYYGKNDQRANFAWKHLEVELDVNASETRLDHVAESEMYQAAGSFPQEACLRVPFTLHLSCGTSMPVNQLRLPAI